MKLNFASIPFDKDGRVEIPELMLRTMHGDPIGLIHGAANISMNIKFSEPSELEFDIPAELNGIPNPDYDRVTGHKQIYTEHYGIYETLNPSVEDDGISVIKHVTAYSLEKELDHKRFFIEEGTFNFWNPATPDETVLGRVVEKAIGWHIGYVSPSLYGVYRTFDQVDDELLNFVYNTLSEKYLCCAVFDTYNRTIDFYDRNSDLGTLPIALDHDNLIVKMDNNEVSEELVTALRPYGSDQLSIREVNPTGSPWIYDLTNFIDNGDLPSALVAKWLAWEAKIAARREYYIALISLRASTSARLLSEKAKLTDMNSDREVLQTERSAIIQALELASSASERAQWQQRLTEKTAEINEKTSAITTQEALCASLENLLDPSVSGSYAAKIQSVVNDLSFTNTANFTAAEQEALQHYFIESDITEETFVATDIDTTISGQSMQITSNTVFSVTGAKISRLSISEGINKTIYSIDGGNLTVGGLIAGGIVGGTLEVDNSKNFVFSAHCGEMTVNGTYATKMMVTANGKYTSLSNNISQNVVDGVTSYIGTTVTFETKSASMYVTATISGLQQFAVQRQLYDFAVEELKNLATYTYEFSVEAGNFLFAREFDQFRNELELGKGIYLNVEGLKVVTPLIEMSFNFDDESKLSLVFSNRIKRHDPVNTLKDLVEKSYSKTRSIDGGKYTQSQVNNQASSVSAFMNAALDAAKNRILAAGNQSVVIDGAGIHIGQTEGEDRNYQLGIVNNMIAMTDDNWEHAKLAIGLFRTPNNGTFFGVNADVIAGKLIVGESMILENTTDTGIMQFKVDASGAWLNNSTFILQKDNSGKILIDPRYGIAAGNNALFTLNGTTVTPSFITNGEITYDNDGMPTNTNFFLNLNDGSSYFRGKLKATSGEIGGFTIEETQLICGNGSSSVGINGSTGGTNRLYAIWAGAEAPANAKFWVKKNGDCKIAGNLTMSGNITWSTSNNPLFASDVGPNGTTTISGDRITTGTVAAGRIDADNLQVKAANITGTITANQMDVRGLNVGNGNFVVSQTGEITLKGIVSGQVSMGSGSSINWANVTNSNLSSNPAYAKATTAETTANTAKTTANTAKTNAATAMANAAAAQGAADDAVAAINALSTNIGYTYIDQKYVISPHIVGGDISGINIYGCKFYDANTKAYITVKDVGGAIRYYFGDNSIAMFEIEYANVQGFDSTSLLCNGNYILEYQRSANQVLFDRIVNVGNNGIRVPYGTSTPGSSTPGYGKSGAVYFKI